MSEVSPLDLVLKDFAACKKYHDAFTQKAEHRYKSYRGVLGKKSDAAKWTSKLHPPYVFQIVETIVGNMIEDRLSFKVRPRPYLDEVDVIEKRKLAADVLEYLLRYEQDLDNFQEKQRPFALQASITGLTVGKVYWKYARGVVNRMETVNEPILHPTTNLPIGTTPTLKPVQREVTLHDNPTFEVVDVRDFFWHEAATSMEKAKYVIHRVWMSYDELQDMAARGVYDKKAVAKLKESRDFSSDASGREEALFQRNRTKDMVEVLEYWTDGRQITVGNRTAVLADRPNPFWHGEKPFVVCSSMPDLFQIPGVSDVEIVEELQEMLWTIMNQRIDNLMLINNAIILLRSDIDDPDAFSFAPGERWLVDDPAQVELWTPNTVPAEVSLQAEQLIKGDIQNITGGMPFVSGSNDGTVDQQTATGVSIVTNLAQKRLAAKKLNFGLAYGRVANQQIQLLQQFMREPRILQIVGKGGDSSFVQVDPEDVQGRFHVEVDAMNDSSMRQEKRAEGQALVQMAAQIAPVMQAVGQPLNMKAFVEDWLEDYDVMDTERYFSPNPQPQLQQQGAQGGGGGGDPQQGGPGGVTSPLATAPQVSPSHPDTMAPSTFMQQALAQDNGGGRQ